MRHCAGKIKVRDEKLVHDLKLKKRDALDKVIDTYAAYVGVIIHRIIGHEMSREDIEEVVSDVFLALWRHVDGLEMKKGSLKSYLGAIARNMAKNKLRQKQMTVPLEGDILLSRPAGLSDGPEIVIEREEIAAVLRQVVLEMPEPEREIFLRYYYSYEKVEEIAAALSMNPATVKTKLARGRKKLKEKLEERGYGDEHSNYRLAR